MHYLYKKIMRKYIFMKKKVIEMIENFIIEVMRQTKIPGLCISIVKDGNLEYANGFGARRLEGNLPMTSDTLVGIGSISKSFTALAIMQLVEQGKINLREPVDNYIDFKLGSKKNPITIHHLLSHSSGFPDLDATYIPIARGLGSSEISTPMSSWNDFILHINGARNEQFSDPDTNFFYNNDFFTVLGLIVEKVSGMKFEDYVKEKILKPLGMNRTIYTREDFEKDEDKLTGYIRTGEGEFKDYNHPFDEKIYAPGGLLSSAKEMGNYLIALMNNGKINESQIIQQSSLDQMWGKYIKFPEETSYVLFKDGWYGYAWMIENFFEYKMVHHGGDILTSSGQLALIPEQKLGIFIGANLSIGAVLSSLCCGIFAIFLGKDINEAVPLLSIDQKLSKLAGKYETYKGIIKIEIEYKTGLLSAKITHPALIEDLKFPLAPLDVDNLKFYVPVCLPNQKVFVQFFIDEKTGKINATADRYYFHKV